MKRHLVLLGLAASAFVMVVAAGSCKGSKSGRGFQLPDGDINKGREAFVQLGCNQCHTVAGVDLGATSAPGPVQFSLGGEVYRVKTYGQLVTAIINPSHIVSPQYKAQMQSSGQPPMPDLTKTMTVRQMIDVVAFLHAHYTKVYPNYSDYSYPYTPSGAPLFPGAPQPID